MKTYQTLIDYNEQLMQEQRNRMQQLEEELSRLEKKQQEVRRSLEHEQEVVNNNPTMLSELALYRQEMINLLEKIADQKHIVTQQIEPVQKTIETLYSNIKKYEIMLEQYQQEQQRKLEADETKHNDDMITLQYLRDKS